jgi:hypothetical protein
MKKIIVFFAFVSALGAFASLPQADVGHQAAAKPLAMLATMPMPQSLKAELYDAI